MADPIDSAATALALDPARAEREARMLCGRMPGDPRPQLILASALRRLGRAGEALPLLGGLARGWPRAVRTRYELGLTLAALGRSADAFAQLDAAVTIDPRYRDGWQALADLAFAHGDAARERLARARLARIDRGDGAPGQAAEAIALGDTARAEALLMPWCRAQPGDADAVYLLASCRLTVRALDDAEALLRHALTLRPDLAAARFDLARVHHAQLDAEAALAALEPLLAADPDNPAYCNLQAACLLLQGDEAGAERILTALATRFPGNPLVLVNRGRALRLAGRRDSAIAAYRAALALRPGTGEAWWSLANLKVGTLTGADEAEMRAQLATALSDEDRLALEYALGRRSEDAGAVDEAFAHYRAGAALARARLAAPPAEGIARADAVAKAYTAALLKTRSGWGLADEAPIFIVGMPRSGSTLVEQILSSHPAVEGTMELPYIPRIARCIAQARGWETLSRDAVAELGADYLRRAHVHRRLGRPRFIDKMPGNFRHIGLIRLILPNARIIDVRRHPMASCFSCFKQLFAEGQEFSYDLDDLAAYYRHYLETVRRFHDVAPGAVHTLIYEDLVEDTEGQVRALLDWLDLPFDAATLRFFENDRAVRTVSSEQVRQPIYRSGLDHWRAFETHLAPLAEGLGDALETWRT